MPTPSLLIVPARFKSGKLYSQLPTSGAGDFTVTRATAATRVNASGLIESVASGIPRLDYFASGGTVGCPALLVEPSGTNLVPNGIGFNTSTGVQYSGVTDSPASAISGTLCTKNEASGTIRYVNQTVSASSLTSSTTYTISRFFKYNGVAFTTSLEFNSSLQWGGVSWKQPIVLSAASGVTLGASTSCTGSVENFGNGWYRVNVRVTTGATIGGAATVSILSELPVALSTGQGFLTACPQLETGSVATSYIPTTTGSVTRNADVVAVSGAVSGSIGQTQGTLYAEVDVRNWVNLSRIFSISDGTATNRIMTLFNTSNRFRVIIDSGGGAAQVDISSASLTNGVHKIAVGYAANDVVFYVNGVLVGSDTTVNIPACSQAFLGKIETSASSNFLNDRIRAAALYTTRLTNDQLAALTTP